MAAWTLMSAVNSVVVVARDFHSKSDYEQLLHMTNFSFPLSLLPPSWFGQFEHNFFSRLDTLGKHRHWKPFPENCPSSCGFLPCSTCRNAHLLPLNVQKKTSILPKFWKWLKLWFSLNNIKNIVTYCSWLQLDLDSIYLEWSQNFKTSASASEGASRALAAGSRVFFSRLVPALLKNDNILRGSGQSALVSH